MKLLLLIQISVLLIAVDYCFARWADAAETPLIIQDLKRTTSVNIDGTSVDRWRWKMKVMRASAREEVGTRTIPYYKSFESVKVLKARTKTKGRWREMTQADVQERTAGEESPGFSGLHELVVNFPGVQEGSEMEFEYEVKTSRALEKGFWGQNAPLEMAVYEHMSWEVESPKELFAEIQDPTSSLRLTRKKTSGKFRVLFETTRPLNLAIADEAEPFLVSDNHVIPQVSTLREWKQYGRHSAGEFEKKLRGPLSQEDQEFAESLKGTMDAQTRLGMILRRITHKIRYFGDWRASDNMYVPRSFAEIERTGSGDCKDFALMAVKLARLAGFEAKPVWVMNSEENPGEFIYRLPTDNSFNHVIVKIDDGKKTWWIDPTHPASEADFRSDAVAGRRGLVLDEKGSELVWIPEIASKDYRGKAVFIINKEKSGRTEVQSSAVYEGYAQVEGAQEIQESGTDFFLQEHVQRMMPQASLVKIIDKKIDETTERRLKGYDVTAEFENFWVQTSAGAGFDPVRPEAVDLLRTMKLEERVSDLHLGQVYEAESVSRFPGRELLGDLKLDCSVESEWLDFSQKVKKNREGLEYATWVRVKKSEVSLRAHRARLEKLQKDLRGCAGRQLLLLK